MIGNSPRLDLPAAHATKCEPSSSLPSAFQIAPSLTMGPRSFMGKSSVRQIPDKTNVQVGCGNVSWTPSLMFSSAVEPWKLTCRGAVAEQPLKRVRCLSICPSL